MSSDTFTRKCVYMPDLQHGAAGGKYPRAATLEFYAEACSPDAALAHLTLLAPRGAVVMVASPRGVRGGLGALRFITHAGHLRPRRRYTFHLALTEAPDEFAIVP